MTQPLLKGAAKVARGWRRMAKQPADPPRIQVACQKCGTPANQLFVAASGPICAPRKSQKENL